MEHPGDKHFDKEPPKDEPEKKLPRLRRFLFGSESFEQSWKARAEQTGSNPVEDQDADEEDQETEVLPKPYKRFRRPFKSLFAYIMGGREEEAAPKADKPNERLNEVPSVVENKPESFDTPPPEAPPPLMPVVETTNETNEPINEELIMQARQTPELKVEQRQPLFEPTTEEKIRRLKESTQTADWAVDQLSRRRDRKLKREHRANLRQTKKAEAELNRRLEELEIKVNKEPLFRAKIDQLPKSEIFVATQEVKKPELKMEPSYKPAERIIELIEKPLAKSGSEPISPEVIQTQVEKAAEKNIPIEAMFERSHEIKDDKVDESGSMVPLAQQLKHMYGQKILQKQLASTQSKLKNQSIANKDIYKKAVAQGACGGLVIVIIIILMLILR